MTFFKSELQTFVHIYVYIFWFYKSSQICFNRCFLKFQNFARDVNCPSIIPYKSDTAVTAVETELVMRQGKY